jgi:uroporphyrin-III C-methyltransferase
MTSETQHTEKPPRRLLSLFIVIIIVALTIWQWPKINSQFVKTQQSINTYFDEIDALGQKKRELMADVAATQQTAEERLSQYETRLAESQKIQEAFDDISEESLNDPSSAALENIEQQIIFAHLHLNLGGDVKAALSALQKAQSLVQEIENEALSALNSSLAQDIENLGAASSIDTKAIISQLDDLFAKIDTMPLIMDTSLTEVDIDITPEKMPIGDGKWFKFIDEMWQDAKSFVHVQKVNRPVIELLSPSQVYFLRENLRLKLLLMRFSLLSHDNDSFNGDLQVAINWINQYFDKNSEPVTDMIQALTQLQDDEIGSELPNVSASLEEIHNYRIKRDEENK